MRKALIASRCDGQTWTRRPETDEYKSLFNNGTGSIHGISIREGNGTKSLSWRLVKKQATVEHSKQATENTGLETELEKTNWVVHKNTNTSKLLEMLLPRMQTIW